MKKFLSVDVGGTKLVYAVTDENGNFLTEVKRKSTPKTFEDLKLIFKEIISEYEKEVDCIAFATAGAVNTENTRVESSTPNMPDGYNSLDFQSLSEKPVYVENDANAAAWAEYKVGSAKGEDNTITITLGTGVGGGFIVDGKIVRGKSGRGGEVGSMKINGRGRICTCKRKDCWESYASGTGFKKTAEEHAVTDKSFANSVYCDKKIEDITTYDILDGIKKNDEYSLNVYNTWKNDIITGLINITDIFDTESIIISGGLCDALDMKELETAVNSEIVVSPVKIKRASAGNYAGITGAALLAKEKYFVNN